MQGIDVDRIVFEAIAEFRRQERGETKQHPAGEDSFLDATVREAVRRYRADRPSVETVLCDMRERTRRYVTDCSVEALKRRMDALEASNVKDQVQQVQTIRREVLRECNGVFARMDDLQRVADITFRHGKDVAATLETVALRVNRLEAQQG